MGGYEGPFRDLLSGSQARRYAPERAGGPVE
jgi:hypothetical protein